MLLGMKQRSRGFEALLNSGQIAAEGMNSDQLGVGLAVAIEEDVFEIAASIAEARGVSIGRAISELLRRGIEADGLGFKG